MSWDSIIDKVAKGGPTFALVILALLAGYAYITGTTDRYTGAEQKRYAEKQDERWESHNALQAARELAVDRELSLLRERMNKLEAIAAENSSTNQQVLIRMERVDTTLGQMTETLGNITRLIEKFGERLVKVERWRDGPK